MIPCNNVTFVDMNILRIFLWWFVFLDKFENTLFLCKLKKPIVYEVVVLVPHVDVSCLSTFVLLRLLKNIVVCRQISIPVINFRSYCYNCYLSVDWWVVGLKPWWYWYRWELCGQTCVSHGKRSLYILQSLWCLRLKCTICSSFN